MLRRSMRAAWRPRRSGFDQIFIYDMRKNFRALVLRIFSTDSGASEERAASVQLQWQDTLKHLRTKNTEGKPLGWMSEADWVSSLDILRKTDRLSTPLEATSIFTNDFIPPAK